MNITYSKKTKLEIINQLIESNHSKTDLLSLLSLSYKEYKLGNSNNLNILTEYDNFHVANYVYNALKNLYNIDCEVSVIIRNNLYKYKILIKNSDYLKNNKDFNCIAVYELLKKITSSKQGRRSFIKSCFIINSSISNPNKYYHVEFVLTKLDLSKLLVDCLNFYNINSSYATRKNKHIIYIKESDSIGNLFRVLGANKQLFELENIILLKEVRSNINRQVNFETANLNRTVNSAVKQIEYIDILSNTIGLENLDRPLYEAAVLRLEHKEASLTDLSNLPNCNISKSGLYHRFKKIERLVHDLNINISTKN